MIELMSQSKSEQYYLIFKDLVGDFLTKEQWEEVYSSMRVLNLKKGENLIEIGQVPTEVGLISKGLLRLYYVDDKGKQHNKSFNGAGFAVATFAELLQRVPSRTFIEALKDTEVLMVEFQKILEWEMRWPKISELILKIFQQLYLEKEQREYEHLQVSLIDRFKNFQERYPKIFREIPQYHIASYLGVSAEALSRTLNKESK
ncbi:MAG: Crp/Fnr family transcriptional regulator [Halobacteriovoraceae bacterium]|nr:Crp/Fnr family transcriptional regulator [Halobacteriovoraceae bacterium]MCB9095244.1 Crp/Fnr family transcriptional regulator [Halobacteriovoraceae bacterium]